LQNKKNAEQLTEQQQFDIRLAFQAHEIVEHKYYLSEQQGCDVGLEQSIQNWVASGHARRFSNDFSQNQENIYASCITSCNDKNCNNSCLLSINEVHDLMGDLEK